MSRGLGIVVAAALLAACHAPAEDSASAPSAPAASLGAATPAGAATVAASAQAPAPNGYDERVVNFGGYGAARFNDDAAAVRHAVGQPLDAAPPPDDPAACHYLLSRPRGPDGFGLAFMMEGGKFVRYDVDTPAIVAPGGLAVGMRAQDVQTAFGTQVDVQPHKYVDAGEVLVVRPADGGESRLVFETDGRGIITAWRIGLEPQVQYVEGCS